MFLLASVGGFELRGEDHRIKELIEAKKRAPVQSGFFPSLGEVLPPCDTTVPLGKDELSKKLDREKKQRAAAVLRFEIETAVSGRRPEEVPPHFVLLSQLDTDSIRWAEQGTAPYFHENVVWLPEDFDKQYFRFRREYLRQFQIPFTDFFSAPMALFSRYKTTSPNAWFCPKQAPFDPEVLRSLSSLNSYQKSLQAKWEKSPDGVNVALMRFILLELAKRRAEIALHLPYLGDAVPADLNDEQRRQLGHALGVLTQLQLDPDGVRQMRDFSKPLFSAIPAEKLRPLLESKQLREAWGTFAADAVKLELALNQNEASHAPEMERAALEILELCERWAPNDFLEDVGRYWLETQLPSLRKKPFLVDALQSALRDFRNVPSEQLNAAEDDLLAHLPKEALAEVLEKNGLHLTPSHLKFLKIRAGILNRGLHIADFRRRMKHTSHVSLNSSEILELSWILGENWKEKLEVTDHRVEVEKLISVLQLPENCSRVSPRFLDGLRPPL